jgi:RHS repeat-associated protein
MWKIFWSGWQTVEQDPAGGQRVFTYDDQGRLVSVKDQLGNLSQTFYDGQNHIIATVSPLNETNQFIFDGNNNVIYSIDSLGYTNQFIFDGQNDLVRSIDPRGNPSTFGYNAQFSLTGSTNGAGDWVNYAFNTDGTLHTRTDAGGTTTYGYDGNGIVNSLTYPSSLGSESFVNNSIGDPTSHTDGNGNVTSFYYNLRRDLTNTVAPTNITMKIVFDAVGNAASATDPRGNSVSNSWSATRHLLKTTLPATSQGAPVVTNFYDSRDWLVKTVDPLLQPTLYTNDSAGRLVSATDPLQRTSFFGYDAVGRKVASTNAAQEVTRQTFDKRGQLLQLTDGAGHFSTRSYDAAGNQIILTNRNGKKWQFQFDGANRLTNTITPLGRSTAVSFNHQGLVATVKDPASQNTSLGYDGKGRLSTRADSIGTTYYGYDANNNRTSVSENGLTNIWTYDAYNHVSGYRDVYGNLIQYRYDANGNVTNLIYPGGKNVYYSYDSNNHLTNVTDWAQRKTSIGYDLAGHVTAITRPNGSYRTIGYDVAGQATNIMEQMSNSLPIAIFKFNWTNSGNMAWEFAAPLPHTATVPTRTMTYDDDNRLATFNGSSVTSDLDGNLTYAPLTNGIFATQTFDARNRYVSSGGVTNFYDAANNRVGQNYWTNVITYVVNPNSKLPQVFMRIKNGVTNYYIYGGGLLYEVTETATATNTRTYHYDYRGSTIALSADNGLVTDRIEYSAYGLTTYRTGNTDTPFLFNGRYGVQSDGNGLLYMRARYYNPYLCRFISSDPSGFNGGLNFYAYANGNPISLIDPSGKWAGLDDLAFTTGGAAIGLISQGVADLIHWKASGWSAYGYSAVAGAAAGETTLYAGPIVGAAAGAAAKNTLDQSQQMAVTGNSFNFVELGVNTGVGAGTAWAAGFIPMPSISGLNAGQGNFAAVNAQITTKLENGTIQNITWSTAGKLFVSETYGDLPGGTVGGLVDGTKGYLFGNSDNATSTGQAPVDWLGNTISSSSTGKPSH